MQGTPTLELQNPLYVRLHAGFTAWLHILNFELTSQRDMPIMLAAFLSFLEQAGCNQIHQIKESHLQDYLTDLYQRPNKRKAGGLSENYIRKQVQVIRKFSRYLSESGQESFEANLKLKGKPVRTGIVLSRTEVEKLYQAVTEDVLGLRDKAMLALYYGSGLRKKEGIELNVKDILLEKELVYVRKGKGYKERFVPLSGRSKEDLENYLTYGRPYLVSNLLEEALLLTHSGTRLKVPSERFDRLRKEAGIRKASLHTLRHSIASHLLHSGMRLEQIQAFLGHSSMESTQLYTHLNHDEL